MTLFPCLAFNNKIRKYRPQCPSVSRMACVTKCSGQQASRIFKLPSQQDHMLAGRYVQVPPDTEGPHSNEQVIAIKIGLGGKTKATPQERQQ